jgi:hypothetical protein
MSVEVTRPKPKEYGFLGMFFIVLLILPAVTIFCIKTHQMQVMLMFWIVPMILWGIFVPLSPWIGFSIIYVLTAAAIASAHKMLSGGARRH